MFTCLSTSVKQSFCFQTVSVSGAELFFSQFFCTKNRVYSFKRPSPLSPLAFPKQGAQSNLQIWCLQYFSCAMKEKQGRGRLQSLHQLLTKETFKMAVRLYRVAAFIHCVPFRLESGSCLRVKMFTSKWRIFLWHLANWIFYFQAAFLVATFAIAVTTEPFGEQLVLHLIYIVAVMFGFVFMLSCYLKPHACLLMLNQHEFIVQKIKGNAQGFI